MEGMKNLVQVKEYCNRAIERASKALKKLPADTDKWSEEDRCECMKQETIIDEFRYLIEFVGI